MVNRWGRPESEWQEMVTAGDEILKDVARFDEDPIDYSEFNQRLHDATGAEPFHNEFERGQAALGDLLAEIVELADGDFDKEPAMLSSAVVTLATRMPSAGFYRLAKRRHTRLVGRSDTELQMFWFEEWQRCRKHYGGADVGSGR